MNFKIAKKEFLDALSLSSRAISSTTPLPSLSGIKISVTDNSLVLVSSDSNISIRTSINNNDKNALIINETGEIVLDARYLLEIVRKIDGEFIQVETIDGTLVKISGGNSEFKVNGMEASEYPNISFDIRDNSPFKLETTLFNQIIDETAFACSEKETRPVLTGVNFKAENGKLYANATDSYRLASKTIDLDSDLNFNITVPSKYLSDIYHSISGEKEVTIAIDSQKISFIFGNTIIDTRLLDDEFPDTRRLIPASFSQKLTVSAREMINAIDRTLFIKADGKNTVKMNIDSEKIELTSTNQSMISSFEEIKVISYEGEPLEISCSGKYLQDAIKAIGADEITISFSGELKPMVVRKEDDDSLIQLISPVRTYR
ncbi:MAG: DNA polymerase III subunit beta [Erysipelotrichaceae bacterium]|nr:DNA polymerase III subunit beta [Erysipelotrichaceae bacterium]MBQ6492395.1 DNA polymerase III subunit beta [Erysipelotrichaceae bacterium]